MIGEYILYFEFQRRQTQPKQKLFLSQKAIFEVIEG